MFFRRLNWNVVGWFRTVSAISYAIILAGVVALVIHSFQAPGGGFQPSHALRLGLSFTGGTDVTVKYRAPATPAAIASALAPIGVRDARVVAIGKAGDATPNERYTVETQTDFGNDTPKVWAALGTVGTVDRAQSQIETVGPSLGREYLVKAGEALLIAIAIQFLFIAFRFGWNYIFGLVVVVALVRDAAMMIGIYAIADKRADDAFLAAVLTVVGYSVMDTIVILDRIRENVRLMPNTQYDRIVNTSILQTMTRSVNTLATVVVTLVALVAFGGASLQNFAFALLVGICSGGYHSIFYSAPLVARLRDRQVKAAEARGLAASPLERPRTVADARAQSANALPRESVLEARKQRREREKKAAVVRSAAGPVRYRKKRAGGTAVAGAAAESEVYEDEDVYDLEMLELEDDIAVERTVSTRGSVSPHGYEIDPLDAQNSGLHEEQANLGHEAITLNFDDDVLAEHERAEHAADRSSPATRD